MSPTVLNFDVSAAIGSGEALCQSGWAFLPERPEAARAVLVCVAGGTYDKHYWHLEVDGHADYSFGEWMARLGYLVVALDHLGVGESSDPVRSGPLDFELLATGDAEVARQVRAGLQRGTLIHGLPPLVIPVIGVAHSMGACITTVLQAKERVYDAVALLGLAVEVANVHEGADKPPTMEERMRFCREVFFDFTGASPEENHALVRRSLFAGVFYAGDVPEDVLAADIAVQSRIPLPAGWLASVPGYLDRYTEKIDVPVFLAFGSGIDTSQNPYAEPAHFSSSPDVTLHMVPKAGHCHNLCSHRRELWDRIASWLGSVVPTAGTVSSRSPVSVSSA